MQKLNESQNERLQHMGKCTKYNWHTHIEQTRLQIHFRFDVSIGVVVQTHTRISIIFCNWTEPYNWWYSVMLSVGSEFSRLQPKVLEKCRKKTHSPLAQCSIWTMVLLFSVLFFFFALLCKVVISVQTWVDRSNSHCTHASLSSKDTLLKQWVFECSTQEISARSFWRILQSLIDHYGDEKYSWIMTHTHIAHSAQAEMRCGGTFPRTLCRNCALCEAITQKYIIPASIYQLNHQSKCNFPPSSYALALALTLPLILTALRTWSEIMRLKQNNRHWLADGDDWK